MQAPAEDSMWTPRRALAVTLKFSSSDGASKEIAAVILMLLFVWIKTSDHSVGCGM